MNPEFFFSSCFPACAKAEESAAKLAVAVDQGG
jgi:hypothetical protein